MSPSGNKKAASACMGGSIGSLRLSRYGGGCSLRSPLAVAGVGQHEGHDYQTQPNPLHQIRIEFAGVESAIEPMDKMSGGVGRDRRVVIYRFSDETNAEFAVRSWQAFTPESWISEALAFTRNGRDPNRGSIFRGKRYGFCPPAYAR